MLDSAHISGANTNDLVGGYYVASYGGLSIIFGLKGSLIVSAKGAQVVVPSGYMTWFDGSTLGPVVPAQRTNLPAQVQLPPIPELTGGTLREADVFCEPLHDATLAANWDGSSDVSLSWEAHGGCGQLSGVLTANYTYAGFTRDHAVSVRSGTFTDSPPTGGPGSANTIEYTLVLQDRLGQRVTAQASISRGHSSPQSSNAPPPAQPTVAASGHLSSATPRVPPPISAPVSPSARRVFP
jgi:hypothetical protein